MSDLQILSGTSAANATAPRHSNGYELPPPPPDCAVGAYVDVETTGLSARDEIIEVAVVLFWYSKATGEIRGSAAEYVGLREPSVPINPFAAAVHGLSYSDLAGKQLDSARIEWMIAQAEIVLAHNASFDKRFMDQMFRGTRERPWACTMKGIQWQGRSRKLQDLLAWHGIKPVQAHRALADVRAAIELISLTAPDGRPYMAQLLPATAQTPAAARPRGSRAAG